MLRMLEKIYAVATLLYFAGGLIPNDMAEGHTSDSVTRLNILVQLVLYPTILLFLFVRRDAVLRGLRMSRWLVALCALILISAAWSVDPLFTVRRGIILATTTVFAVYLASSFDWEEQVNLFAWMLVIGILGSFIIVAVSPEYGISHDVHAGDWRGLFGHKNVFGRIMAFGILLLGIAKPAGVPKWLRLVCVGGAIALLALSDSATSIIAGGISVVLYAFAHLLRVKQKKTMPLWVPLAPLLLIVAGAVALNAQTFLKLAGRDSTFTGRTSLWSIATDGIRESPFFGHGYAVFWRELTNAPVGFPITSAPHAHNGYLDACLDVGFVGLSILAVSFGLTFWRALYLFQRGKSRAANWTLVFLFFFAAYNSTESSIFRSHTFLWVPFVAVVVSTALIYEEARETESEFAELPEYAAETA